MTYTEGAWECPRQHYAQHNAIGQDPMAEPLVGVRGLNSRTFRKYDTYPVFDISLTHSESIEYDKVDAAKILKRGTAGCQLQTSMAIGLIMLMQALACLLFSFPAWSVLKSGFGIKCMAYLINTEF